MKMRSIYKIVYLYILLTAVLVTVVCARHNDNFYSTNSHNDGSDSIRAQWNAKHSNRNSSEMIRMSSMPHRFRHHHNTPHHLSPSNGLATNYKYQKYSPHQSNDDAGSSRLPGVQRHSAHIHENDDAGAPNNRHIHRFDTLQLHHLQQQHHELQRLHREQQQQQLNDQREEHHYHHHPHHHHHNKTHLDEITTQDPFRLSHSQNIRTESTRKPQIATTKTSTSMKWRKGLSSFGAENHPVTSSNRKLGIQKQSLSGSGSDLHRKGISITTTTTTPTTTTTLAPEPSQVNRIHSLQSGFNGIDDGESNDTDQSEDDYYENDDFNDGDDEDDDDGDYDEDIEFTNGQHFIVKEANALGMKKGTRSITSDAFGRSINSNRLSYENYQKDDPVRNALASTPNQRNRQHPNALEQTSMETSTRRNSPNIRNGPNPGEITQHKFNTLGTPEAVDHTRNDYRRYQQLADWNRRLVHGEGACRVPKPRIIQLEGRHTSKTYTPHCVLLHRCSDETGCCRSDLKTCQPFQTEEVKLYFHVEIDNKSFFEMIPFINHTACSCVDKTALAANVPTTTTTTDTPSQDSTIPPERYGRSRHITQRHIQRPEHRNNYRDIRVSTTPKQIQCPTGFVMNDGDGLPCKWDCVSSSGKHICEQLKKGLSGFSINERRCINSKQCEPPTCQYGEYNSKTGTCPRQEESTFFSNP